MDNPSIVCVVDDDEAVLASVQALLTRHGHAVDCFSSAERFLTEARMDRPGCVVTDLKMPGIDGLELQRRLLAADSPLSVVVVTGVADVPTAVTLMESGAVTLLEKPYNPADLLSAVERAAESSRRRWRRSQARQDVARRLSQLTDEERTVMDAMLSDEPTKAIARLMDLGMRTIDRRRRSVLEKLGVKSVTALALLLGANANSTRGKDGGNAPEAP